MERGKYSTADTKRRRRHGGGGDADADGVTVNNMT